MYSLIGLVRSSVVELESKVSEPGADIVLLQSPYGVMGFGAPWTYYGETKDQSRRFWQMQIGRRELIWTRIDERTFELESSTAEMLTSPFEQLFLTESPRLPLGPRFEKAFMRVVVVEQGRRGIRKFRVELNRSLDDGSIVFLRAVGDGWEPITPPQPGESITLPVPRVTHPILP